MADRHDCRHTRKQSVHRPTHSPYVITALLENPCLDPGLFFTYTEEGKSYVKTASGQDIQDILGHALKYLRHHKYDADENELKDLFQK